MKQHSLKGKYRILIQLMDMRVSGMQNSGTCCRGASAESSMSAKP
jgi:hypothetical protein